jgi:pyruvate/2-oxoacid:ferredoxin oxidoreductase alpha subunit
MERLNDNGVRTNLLQFIDIHPLDWESVADILANCRRWVSVEGNYSAQLSRWIRTNTGLKPAGTVTRYDGRPLNPVYIVEQLQSLLVKV